MICHVTPTGGIYDSESTEGSNREVPFDAPTKLPEWPEMYHRAQKPMVPAPTPGRAQVSHS